MLKRTEEENSEPSTVSQAAVERLRQFTDEGVGAELKSDSGRTDTNTSGNHPVRRVAPVKAACSILIAVGLGTALLWPVTSSMAKNQLKMLGGINTIGMFQGVEGERVRERAYVAEHPNDATIQFGGALRGSLPGAVSGATQTSGDRANQLRTVSVKFPDHPEILAATLRAESQTEVIVHRPESSDFLENKQRSAATTGTVKRNPPKRSDAAMVQRFIEQCLIGERVDPDNAYFPMLRAMAYTELNQDAKAFETLRLAASKKAWREYIPEEFVANRTVNRAMYGNAGLVPEMAISAAILFPHYSSLRELSRVVVAEAIKREIKGDFAGGLALRRDLFDVSEKVRNESTTFIGSLVGSAMMDLSRMRPGGMLQYKAKLSRKDGPTAEEAKEARDINRARFVEFATKHGDATFANRAVDSAKVGDIIRETTRNSMDRGIYGMESITRLTIGQGVALILLSNMVWMLVIGAIASAVVRSPRFVAGSRLTPGPFVAAVAGIALAMVISGAITGISVGYNVSAVSGMTGEAGSIVPIAAVAAGMVLAIPTLVLILLSIWAAINKRASFTRTITGGFAAAALPIATVMVIAWVGIVYYCAGLDTRGSIELMEMLQHEGKYLFRIVGQKWPV